MNLKEKLEQTIVEINKSNKGTYLNKIQCLSEYDYLFSFSRAQTKEILISLNVKNPFVKLTKDKYSFNDSSSFFNRLKVKLLNSLFLGASSINDDNILKLDFLKTTDTYDKIHYSLIFEIFKSNANLILLVDDKIDEAFRYKGLDTHHPIIKNMIYIPPKSISIEKDVKEKDILNEENYYNNLENQFLVNKYKPVALIAKRKLKSLLKKLEKIKEDQHEAEEKLKYKDYADALLINLSEVKRGDSFFVYEGEKINLNESFSPSENLERFYKFYKKAKATIESTKDYILKTEDEIDYLNSVIASLEYYKEDDYKELIEEFINKKYLKNNPKIKPKNLKNAAKPYYILFNGTKIGFGKNSVQNDYLSFKLAKKEDYFLHIKNAHGNHVIIFNSNVDDELLEFALEFCIYLAKKKDGEVVFASVKDIRKGNESGLVKLNKYESYYIKEYNYDFKSYLDKAIRF